MKSSLSICIPNFNRSIHLQKLIFDLQNQTVEPYEVIISDDCSSKRELDTIKKYMPINYRLIVNKYNIGLIKNINELIKKAKGKYLAIVHNDDRLSKYYIEEFDKAYNKYPGFNIYTSNAMGINESSEIIGDYRIFEKDTVLNKLRTKYLWDKFYFTYISITGTTIYKTSVIKNNLFEERYGNEADLEKSLYFLIHENIMYINKPLYFTLLHNDQVSRKNKLTNLSLENYITNCLDIYTSYYPYLKKCVPQYFERIKMIYFLQLFLKYNYPLKKIFALLRIKSVIELSSIMLCMPRYIFSNMQSRLIFKKNLNEYKKYFNLNS